MEDSNGDSTTTCRTVCQQRHHARTHASPVRRKCARSGPHAARQGRRAPQASAGATPTKPRSAPLPICPASPQARRPASQSLHRRELGVCTRRGAPHEGPAVCLTEREGMAWVARANTKWVKVSASIHTHMRAHAAGAHCHEVKVRALPCNRHPQPAGRRAPRRLKSPGHTERAACSRPHATRAATGAGVARATT